MSQTLLPPKKKKGKTNQYISFTLYKKYSSSRENIKHPSNWPNKKKRKKKDNDNKVWSYFVGSILRES